jgi:hypothetical protein
MPDSPFLKILHRQEFETKKLYGRERRESSVLLATHTWLYVEVL